jgi:hypothetical protein
MEHEIEGEVGVSLSVLNHLHQSNTAHIELLQLVFIILLSRGLQLNRGQMLQIIIRFSNEFLRTEEGVHEQPPAESNRLFGI